MAYKHESLLSHPDFLTAVGDLRVIKLGHLLVTESIDGAFLVYDATENKTTKYGKNLLPLAGIDCSEYRLAIKILQDQLA
jgi:hypothetical protein